MTNFMLFRKRLCLIGNPQVNELSRLTAAEQLKLNTTAVKVWDFIFEVICSYWVMYILSSLPNILSNTEPRQLFLPDLSVNFFDISFQATINCSWAMMNHLFNWTSGAIIQLCCSWSILETPRGKSAFILSCLFQITKLQVHTNNLRVRSPMIFFRVALHAATAIRWNCDIKFKYCNHNRVINY